MSFAKRNSAFANAGIVVEVGLEDISGLSDATPMAGIAHQQLVERLAHDHGGGGVVAPAQRLDDFVAGRPSTTLPQCSYPPGVTVSTLSDWLPGGIAQRLQTAFKAFDRKMKGFITNEAVVVGVESRTSSPVRIPRDPMTLQHIGLAGLFPCGEGAGYARRHCLLRRGRPALRRSGGPLSRGLTAERQGNCI